MLTGDADSNKKAGTGFSVVAKYDSDFSDFPKGPRFKRENGSAAADDTFFLNVAGATFTGYGDFAGWVMTAERKPEPTEDGVYYATQIGSSNGKNRSANNKNFEYGLANWFTFSTETTGDCKICTTLAASDGRGRQGDFNLNLDKMSDSGPDLSPVPLPASLPLLLAGFGDLAALRRRKKA